jgi:hypothetical protein
MTGAVLDRPASLFDRAGGALEAGAGDEVTLEERLNATLRAVRDGSTECPVCAAPMVAEAGHARCTGCGSRLR